MGTFLPLKRHTLHILHTGPKSDPGRGHLHVVLTNKCRNGTHLLVPISGKRAGYDNTCLIGPGDHDFIVKDSFVFYFMASLWKTEAIVKRVTDGDITYKGLLDEKLFDRICIGLVESRLVPPRLKKYFQENKAN